MPRNSETPDPATSLLPAAGLTERTIKAAQPGDVLNDTVVRGLSLRAFPQSKAFYLYFRTKAGVQRRPKLGDHGQITLTQARKVAQELLAEVAAGRDPAQARADARAELTLDELWSQYEAKHAAKKKSGDQDKARYERVLRPAWGSRKISAISFRDVEELVEDIGAEYPTSANRTLALLSTMYGFAIKKLRWPGANPCHGVDKFPETKRQRYLKGEEPARIAEILDREAARHPAGVAFIYLLILTGARKGEIAAARWDWLAGSVLSLPDSKTGAKQVYLPPQALDVLERLPRTSGTITGIQSPKKLWERVRAEAGCPDLRLHDLRHSFASAALSAGLSLAQIGELLGHKSTQTTKRYAHLVEEVAVSAATAAADRIFAGMKKAPVEAGAKPLSGREETHPQG